MLHQLQQAIEPAFPLQQILNQWSKISKDLAELPRKRVIQLDARKHIP